MRAAEAPPLMPESGPRCRGEPCLPGLVGGRAAMTPQEWVDLVYVVYSVGAAIFMLWFARTITKPRR